MTRRAIRRLRKLAKILFQLFFIVATIMVICKFINAEDVYDKVEYGVYSIMALIIIFGEW